MIVYIEIFLEVRFRTDEKVPNHNESKEQNKN